MNFDLAALEEDLGTVDSVTWTVEAGQATIGDEALASSVATAEITVAEVGTSRISVKFTNTSNGQSHYESVHVRSWEPEISFESDGYET